ncbi:sigma 54-interacting transcriptional regulator [Candidatus Clostridium radicumherbarum]|uniref:Sigma 54-interacting transcriptional regulator n=1 Tax=Candidatus Clostridium radicumherbarum TaxID=3381662 RepID=A0ABW8TTQ9_9CLOT
MKNIDAVNDYITNKLTLDYINDCIKNQNYFGVYTSDIEKNLHIVRNNASTILNTLFKQNKLVKINSRPVSFFPKAILASLNLINSEETNLVYSLQDFKTLLSSLKSGEATGKSEDNISEDPFTQLVGANNSLINQIGQAKAALMYPPKGLHTLLLGESGVGKSTFASSMYEYAKVNKGLDEGSFPFVAFNCSDYFNNPQLLLSELFGHVKGSFTGANSDKEGLVAKANGGILFLDEVHRLPPDGQEMLFYLIDKGQYHKLGESGNTNKSNVMIIAATTEEPNEALLTTFLRRIPVVITLPSFREKAIEEKMEIIETLFYYECINLNKDIRISPEVLKALALYPFKGGNIGQLKSEIKLVCAKSFLNYIKNKNNISIEFEMLSKDIIDYVFSNNKININDKNYMDMINEYLVLFPGNKRYSYVEKANDNIYDKINDYIKKLKDSELSSQQFDLKIENLIDEHFKYMLNNISAAGLNKSTLYKVIPKEVVDLSAGLINIAEEELNVSLNPKFIFAFAFHINGLLQRIREGKLIVNSNILKVRSEYPSEYNASKVLIKKISDTFGVIVPEDEKGFLSILLANNKLDSCIDSKIGIIVICHGQSTASSMAEVANKLLNTNIVKAIDMPLDSSVDSIYNALKNTALAANKGHGILLAVDMGSLCNFGDKLERETSIKIKTIANISTLLLLEAVRKIMYSNDDLDTIYTSLAAVDTITAVSASEKKKAIVTLCVTGQGTGMMAKQILCQNLDEKYKKGIELIVTNYSEVKNNIKSLTDKYDILAFVGSINPNIGIPYFPINKILSSQFKEEFSKYLDTKIQGTSHNQSYEKNVFKSVYELSKDMLEQYLKFVNPKIAVANIKNFIIKMGLDDSISNKDNIMDLILHMGCMLDRCIHGDKVRFDNVEEFKLNNPKQFAAAREACDILGAEYDIDINDDEVCYIIKVINK